MFNRVLRELSPTRSDAFDEFDAVGLYHQRHTHDWAKLAGSWPQILGTLRDLLIEADPRPRRAFALVRRIIEDPQGRLHPPDRHQAVARLHKTSLLAGR